MSTGRSFEFDRVDAFVPGALGEPGQRVFYLQERAGEQVVSLRCEKQQVGMLGRYLTQLAEAIGPVEPDRDIVGLVEPVTEQWTVGQLSVGVDEENGLIMVTADELTVDELEVDHADPGSVSSLLRIVGEDEEITPQPASCSAPHRRSRSESVPRSSSLPDGQRAGSVGRPLTPDGHDCPRWN
ncbi:MAG: DUF3090 family protein [Microthrixaceae bacterium]|nr:DUF3090 family protein [Microthrixaceae bacterium]